jgi:hypothetical protein
MRLGIRTRLRLAWHLLRGGGVVTNCTFHMTEGGSIILPPEQDSEVWVMGNRFIQPPEDEYAIPEDPYLVSHPIGGNAA